MRHPYRRSPLPRLLASTSRKRVAPMSKVDFLQCLVRMAGGPQGDAVPVVGGRVGHPTDQPASGSSWRLRQRPRRDRTAALVASCGQHVELADQIAKLVPIGRAHALAAHGRVRTSNRPVFAPETPERRASKRGGLDKSALKSLAFFVERSLGKVFDKI